MAVNTRFVPWHSWEEWSFVADAFCGRRRGREEEVEDDDENTDDEKKKKQQTMMRVVRAIEIVQMWRVRGRVPLAIDAHAQIAELHLMDEEAVKAREKRQNQKRRVDGGGEETTKAAGTAAAGTAAAGTYQSESTLRLSYAMTLTRLVNGICDPSQKGKFAVSVQTLASQLNVPRTLVDIRHDSTHNQLPSIQRLRKASEDAIGWLNVHYWERQKRKLERVKEEMRLAIRAMAECEKGHAALKKSKKDNDSNSDSDESMYDSEEEMNVKTAKANKLKQEKETRKKTKNSAVGRLKRLVPKSKPDRMLVQAFARELLDATTSRDDRGDRNNDDDNHAAAAAAEVIVHAFTNVIDQIESRVVDGFSCAVLEFGTEELLFELANDERKVINPVFEFAWKRAVSLDAARATFIAEWYQRRSDEGNSGGGNTTEYVRNMFQKLMSSSDRGGSAAFSADGGGSKNKKKNAKRQQNNNNNKKQQQREKEEENEDNATTSSWRKAKPGEWIPGAPIGAPLRAIFVPREITADEKKVVVCLESDAFTPRKKHKTSERRDAMSFPTRNNDALALDLEYNEEEEEEDGAYDDDDDDDDEQPNSLLLRDEDDEEEEEEETAKAKINVNGARVKLNHREVDGVKDSVACLL
jgi:hypothetical protein